MNILKAEGDDVTWAMSKGGVMLGNIFTPPIQEILYSCLFLMMILDISVDTYLAI